MIANLNQVEYILMELRRDRMQEATQWRLVRQCITNNPSPYHQLSTIQSHTQRHSDLEPCSLVKTIIKYAKMGKSQ